MQIPLIDQKLNKIIEEYETRDPYLLSKYLDVAIREENLGDIYGYYNKVKRVKMIHLNTGMNDHFKRFTCAHELGHSILHPNENTPMLSKASIVSELKIEKEANYFATQLIVDYGNSELEYLNEYQKLGYYGLSEEFSRYLY